MTETPGDLDLWLAELRAGDQQALGKLFTHYRAMLRRMVAIRLDPRLNGRVSPSDVLQEAYIDAVKRSHHYFEKADQPFFGWLRLIVGQRLIDIHREHLGALLRDATREVSLQQRGIPAASSTCLAARLVAHLTSPSDAAVRNETLALLETALNEMDPLDREVLTLRHFEELSNNEVAELLGIQKAAASKRYMRALARLRDILRQLPAFQETRL